jgi:hypothetical protein
VGSDRSRRWLAWIVLLGVPAALVAWDAVQQRGFARFQDNALVYAHLRLEAGRQWAEGRLPSWNPYKRAGAPLLADSVSAALYPPNLLFAAARSREPFGTLELVAALHHLLAAAGAYVLLRTLGLARLPAVSGGLVYALSGFCVVITAQWIALQNAMVWAPLVLACLERARRPGRLWLWSALGAGVFAVQLLAGYPELSFYTGLLCAAYALAMILREPPRWRRPMAAVLAIGAGGILLAAPQLLPTLAAYAESTRPALTPYSDFVWSSARAFELLTAGLPAAAFELDLGGSYLGTGLLYTGGASLAFAGAALRRPDAVTVWAALVVVVGGVLMLGEHSPVGAIAYHLPGFNSFRWPFKHAFEVSLGVSVLTAVGMQRFIRGEPGVRALVVALLVAVAALGLVASRFTPVSPTPAIVDGGVALALAGMVLAGRPGLTASLALGALVLGLAWNRETALGLIRWLAGPPVTAPAELIGRLRGEPGSRFLLLVHTFSREALAGDRPTALRLSAVHGAGPFLWRPLADQLGMDDVGRINRPLRDATLDLLGVRHVLSPRIPGGGFAREDWMRSQPGGRVEKRADALLLTRSTALPFAYLVDSVVFSALPSAPGPARAASLSPLPGEGAAETPTSTGRVALLRVEPGSVDLDVRIDGPTRGFLVLSQLDYPGWSATSDGETVPIRRVHGLVQGVWLSPGQQRLSFRYRAPGFRAGLCAAAGSVLLFGILSWRERSRS